MNDTNTMNTLEIAQTIKDQLGDRCLFMLGARHFHTGADHLSFRIRGSHKANAIRIALDPMDTYTVTFWKIRSPNIKEVGRFEGIYCDMLYDLIRRVTGLNTNL